MRGLILKISSLTWHNLLFRAADREELSLLRIGNPSQMSWDEMRGWGWHLVFCISTATDRTFHNLVFLEQIPSWSWIIRSRHHGSQQVESGWWSVECRQSRDNLVQWGGQWLHQEQSGQNVTFNTPLSTLSTPIRQMIPLLSHSPHCQGSGARRYIQTKTLHDIVYCIIY